MKTIKKVPIIPVFLESYMPEVLEEGKLYISEQYSCAIHLCLCGCGGKAVTPLGQDGWELIKHNDGSVSLTPSIGNWIGENPFHAHYIITKNIANFV